MTALVLTLVAFGQVQEVDLVGEKLAGALKVTGRYKNLGDEDVTPECKVLVFDENDKLLASGLAIVEPGTIGPGKTATLTGLVVELPAGAETFKVNMVAKVDGKEEEIEPLDARSVPLGEYGKIIEDARSNVDHISIEKQKRIYHEYFDGMARIVSATQKLPKSRRNDYFNRANDRLYERIAKKHHATKSDVASILVIGLKENWKKPPDEESAGKQSKKENP